MLAAAERAMVRMLEALDKPESTAKQITEALNLMERLRRERLQRAGESTEGIEALRELTDPAKLVERLHKDPAFRTALEAKGWLPPPVKRVVRTPADVDARERYERQKREINGDPPAESDDRELRKMIGEPAQ